MFNITRFVAVAVVLIASACSPTVRGAGNPKSSCMPCLTSHDCGTAGEVCTKLPADNLCTATCTTNADCGGNEICFSTTASDGSPVSACVDTSGVCSPTGGSSTDAGNPDSGNNENPPDSGNVFTRPDAGNQGQPDAGSSMSCAGYAAPNETGGSCPCQSGHTCAANNCYGGYYCELSDNRCVMPPSNCSTPDAGNTNPPDAGTPDAGNTNPPDAGPPDAGNTNPPDAGGGGTGTVTASGGTESQLYFAVIGDTRPANGCETSASAYPTSIITKIYQDIQAMNPRPAFVITTGDYQYVDIGSCSGESNCPCGSLATTQVGYYMTARQNYSGILWPAMGNHECDGFTDSDCGSGCPSGDSCSGSNTPNFLAFQSQMLSPIGETLPYYTRTVTATDNSWKATFIMVAPNYWSGTQQSSWLQSQLSAAGTHSSSNYIFVVHHEDSTASSPPSGLSEIESEEQGVETVSIVGHSHFWQWGAGGMYNENNAVQLLVGNGGAPLTSGSSSTTENNSDYGYTTILRQSDGSLTITNYDYSNGTAVNTVTASP